MKRRSPQTKPNFKVRDAKSKPQSIEGLLSTALGSYQLKKKVEEYALVPRWKEIVGDEIARVAYPEKIIRGKILQVRVEDSVWVQELTLQKSAILENLHRLGTGAVIEDIRFSAGNPKTFTK